MREAGVALVVPLVSQGELIGTLNLGPRLSEQDYSTDDRRLLTTLAAQAAPAIRVAQLVREQAAEAAERERLEQEMRVATLIQQQFLPRELPNLAAVADRRVLRPGARGRRRLLRLHRDARRPDRHRRRRRHRQGRAGGARDGPDPLGPARRGEPIRLAGRDPRPRERPARTGDAGPDVRHVPVRDPRSRDRAASSWPTPATTCRTSGPTTASSSSARPGCRSASCRGSSTRRPRASSRPAATSCSTRTGSSRPTIPPSEMYRLPAPARGDDGRRRRQRAARPAARRRCTGSPAPTGSRRTTSRSSRCAGHRASPMSSR